MPVPAISYLSEVPICERPAVFALSPWVLGYAGDHQAWLNEIVTGLLLIALSASAAGIDWRARRRRATRPVTPAGVAAADQPGTQG
jgi:SPW repeat